MRSVLRSSVLELDDDLGIGLVGRRCAAISTPPRSTNTAWPGTTSRFEVRRERALACRAPAPRPPGRHRGSRARSRDRGGGTLLSAPGGIVSSQIRTRSFSKTTGRPWGRAHALRPLMSFSLVLIAADPVEAEAHEMFGLARRWVGWRGSGGRAASRTRCGRRDHGIVACGRRAVQRDDRAGEEVDEEVDRRLLLAGNASASRSWSVTNGRVRPAARVSDAWASTPSIQARTRASGVVALCIRRSSEPSRRRRPSSSNSRNSSSFDWK